MTYPPQQPDPYGQQPGSYGQQPGGAFPPDGPQQQHGCQSETQQYGQPGQHGQSWGQRGQQNSFGADPGGTQQFPQSDPYGQQQDPYGQKQTSYDPYGQQSGFSDGEPPRRKTGLIVGIAIAAVVVVGGVVALIGGITQTGQTAKMPIKATLNGQTDFGFVGFKQESGQDRRAAHRDFSAAFDLKPRPGGGWRRGGRAGYRRRDHRRRLAQIRPDHV